MESCTAPLATKTSVAPNIDIDYKLWDLKNWDMKRGGFNGVANTLAMHELVGIKFLS